MPELTLVINGTPQQIDSGDNQPLLWLLRERLNLVGTKYGCGIGRCGCCMVLINGAALQSCLIPVNSLDGAEITTIEGLSSDGSHPLQLAWQAEDVPQCGFCQAGQIISAVALLSSQPKPSDADIDNAMAGNLCRCGTYQRIRRAIRRVAAQEPNS